MEPFIVAAILALAVVILFFLLHRKMAVAKNDAETTSANTEILYPVKENMFPVQQDEIAIAFNYLDALSETEEAALVEIKDQKVLAKIDSAIPGTFQAIANAGAAHQYQEGLKKAGQLYQAIIPKDAVLANSSAMEDAKRGIYHGANGIKGHANLVPVDSNTGAPLDAMNVVNAVMGVAAMVVGQYYMTQINSQLSGINSQVESIAAFQDREYQSRVYALVADVQKSSQFQVEIVENEELRKRELDHLKNLEHECAELLGQANRTIKDFEKKKGLDYPEYEKLVAEAQTWYQYQQILLDLMAKIEDLSYALNLGQSSRENCYALLLPYAKQAEDALKSLEAWHKETGVTLEIDLDAGRRSRQGLEGLIMKAISIFDEDLRYKSVPEKTVTMITAQSGGQRSVVTQSETDLFQEDVRLVAKDGKLYYLPEEKHSKDT